MMLKYWVELVPQSVIIGECIFFLTAEQYLEVKFVKDVLVERKSESCVSEHSCLHVLSEQTPAVTPE
jgi:hypothetical protein